MEIVMTVMRIVKYDDDNNENNCDGYDHDVYVDSNKKLTILTKTNTINEPVLLTGVLRAFTCQCAPQTDQTRAPPLPSKIILSIFVKDTKGLNHLLWGPFLPL